MPLERETPPFRRAMCLGARASCPHRGWHSRGYLPHFDQPNEIQSITFRLADSVPADTIGGWRAELGLLGAGAAADPRCAELRKRIERYSDRSEGVCWLRRPAVAEIVQSAMLHFDGARYRLLAWCVMPNHVHALAEVLGGFPLGSVVHSWKSFTANQCNRALGRTGSFWMPDYFDRFIRNADHLARAINYIERNPVLAGLCDRPEAWPWGHARQSEE